MMQIWILSEQIKTLRLGLGILKKYVFVICLHVNVFSLGDLCFELKDKLDILIDIIMSVCGDYIQTLSTSLPTQMFHLNQIIGSKSQILFCSVGL